MSLLVTELRRELDHNARLVSLLAPAGVVRRAAEPTAAGRLSLDGIDLEREAVVQGVVTRHGAPLRGAHVRLLDGRGAFVAEVPTSADGTFRFFAEPGEWTVAVLAGEGRSSTAVTTRFGAVVEIELALELPAA